MAPAKKIDWLILGGEGQLSLSLQSVLIDRGESFVALDHKELDVCEVGQVASLRDTYLPRVIFNGAAWTNVESAEENEERASAVNAGGAKNVASLALQLGATLTHISTDYVFSGEKEGEHNEDEQVAPISAYGRSKALGEKAVLSLAGLDFYLVRTAWLYGSQGRNFAKTILRKALANEDSINVIDDQWGQPTSADDLAERIYEMVSLKLPMGIYHGTNSGSATWHEFAREIFRLAGADEQRVLPVSSDSYPSKVKRPANSVLGHSKWLKSTLPPMRDWRLALAEAMPTLIKAVEMEE